MNSRASSRRGDSKLSVLLPLHCVRSRRQRAGVRRPPRFVPLLSPEPRCSDHGAEAQGQRRAEDLRHAQRRAVGQSPGRPEHAPQLPPQHQPPGLPRGLERRRRQHVRIVPAPLAPRLGRRLAARAPPPLAAGARPGSSPRGPALGQGVGGLAPERPGIAGDQEAAELLEQVDVVEEAPQCRALGSAQKPPLDSLGRPVAVSLLVRRITVWLALFAQEVHEGFPVQAVAARCTPLAHTASCT
mmetsp:Transcript_108180/g.316347  ORF Transcript_108180/g.316347 Transcript_108180/m.316347 type:complete len:242 (-) Transcript_108180:1986-2711(-)